MAARPFSLVVSQGLDAGAHLFVHEVPRLIGRTQEADMPLSDPSISRKHLRVVAELVGVRVRIVAGAAPFIYANHEHSEALVRVGERFVVGNTVFTVGEPSDSRRGSIPAPGDRPEVATRSDLSTHWGGLTADVRGLSSVLRLLEVLDGASDRDGLDAAVSKWARSEIEARAVRVLAPGELDGDHVVEYTDAGRANIAVPARTAATAGLAFGFPVGPTQLDESLKRVLIVAGHVYASSLSRILAQKNAEADRDELRSLAVGSARGFLGASPAAEQIATLLPRLAASDATVLLLGESGVGKTFVARLIHEAGPRAKEPLRVINCAAIPENLVESELFGHEKGAFTGADAPRAGVFESAGRGTVLLDEIGELPASSQAKLLRVLEDKRFERLGSNRSIPLQARVLTATNRDLARLSQEGRFRSDLYFRVSVVSVRVPALRERGDDVILLARRLLADLAVAGGRRVSDFAPETFDLIQRYPWPGNVRELRNAIEHAIVLGDGTSIQPGDFPEAIRLAVEAARIAVDPRRATSVATSGQAVGDGDVIHLPANLEWLEGRAIDAALRAAGGNRTRAAAILGINRVTLYKKLKKEEGDSG